MNDLSKVLPANPADHSGLSCHPALEALFRRACRLLSAVNEWACAGRFWVLKVTLLSTLFCFLFSGTPPILIHRSVYVSFDLYALKYDHPMTDMRLHVPDPLIQEAKLNYRLTVPMLGHLFGFRRTGTIVLAHLCGIAIFGLVALATARVTFDRQAALGTALLTATLPSGYLAFYVSNGLLFDPFALFFLTLAIAVRNPVGVFSAVFLACWTDERAVLASSLVWLYHFVLAQSGVMPRWNRWKLSLVVVLAWCLYFASRWWVANTYGLSFSVAGVGLSAASISAHLFHWTLWGMLKFGWLLLLICMVAAVITREHRVPTLLLVGGVGLIAVGAMLVYDLTKSMAYILPGVPIIALLLSRYLGVRLASHAILLAALASCVLPNYDVYGSLSGFIYPAWRPPGFVTVLHEAYRFFRSGH